MRCRRRHMDRAAATLAAMHSSPPAPSCVPAFASGSWDSFSGFVQSLPAALLLRILLRCLPPCAAEAACSLPLLVAVPRRTFSEVAACPLAPSSCTEPLQCHEPITHHEVSKPVNNKAVASSDSPRPATGPTRHARSGRCPGRSHPTGWPPPLGILRSLHDDTVSTRLHSSTLPISTPCNISNVPSRMAPRDGLWSLGTNEPSHWCAAGQMQGARRDAHQPASRRARCRKGRRRRGPAAARWSSPSAGPPRSVAAAPAPAVLHSRQCRY